MVYFEIKRFIGLLHVISLSLLGMLIVPCIQVLKKLEEIKWQHTEIVGFSLEKIPLLMLYLYNFTIFYKKM